MEILEILGFKYSIDQSNSTSKDGSHSLMLSPYLDPNMSSKNIFWNLYAWATSHCGQLNKRPLPKLPKLLAKKRREKSIKIYKLIVWFSIV